MRPSSSFVRLSISATCSTKLVELRTLPIILLASAVADSFSAWLAAISPARMYSITPQAIETSAHATPIGCFLRVVTSSAEVMVLLGPLEVQGNFEGHVGAIGISIDPRQCDGVEKI